MYKCRPFQSIYTGKVRQFIDMPQVFVSGARPRVPTAVSTVVVWPVAATVVVVLTTCVVTVLVTVSVELRRAVFGVGNQGLSAVGDLEIDIVVPVDGAECRLLFPVWPPTHGWLLPVDYLLQVCKRSIYIYQ